MVNAGLVGVVVVFTIIGAAFSSYYVTVAPINGQISSYQSVITSLSEHASTVISTTTQYVVSVVTETNAGATTTITSVTTLTSVSTSTVTEYPLTDNLTVWFQNSGSTFNYAVNSATFAKSSSTNLTSIPITISPIYTNEAIDISASCSMPCTIGMSFNATLYFNSNVVRQASGNATQGLSFNYTL